MYHRMNEGEKSARLMARLLREGGQELGRVKE